MIKNKLFYFIQSILILLPALSIAQRIELVQQGKPVSIRGLSVVNDKIAWISSSQGYIAITADGGKSWNWRQVKGFENSDFRDIEAFSAKEAIVMSSGTPAVILKTNDGGINWKINYRKDDSIYFLDAMDFDNPKHGFALGDPIDNNFLLLETKNGGDNWTVLNGPDAHKDQAAFAASGTCINANGLLRIVTGGQAAELINQRDSGWSHHRLPVMQNRATQGAFSFAIDAKQIVVIGGDYRNDKKRDSTVCYSTDGGLTWHLPKTFPSGYQSCITQIKTIFFLSTGTAGTNISTDGGKNWHQIDQQSFNVCRKAKHGNLVILAGADGKIGILKN